MRYRVCNFALFFAFVYCLFSDCQGQSLEHSVYLIGSTSGEKHLSNLELLSDFLENQDETKSIIHLGDILNNNGLVNGQIFTDNPKIECFNKLSSKSENGLLFLSGDKDWDNSGLSGLHNVRALEDYITENVENSSFYISNGCPGPEIIDISDHIRLIIFNSAWWIHPFDKPIAPDTDCDIITKEELIEELQKAVEDADNKNIILASHHPFINSGVYGGRMPLKKHIFPLTDSRPNLYFPLPVFGTYYASYRQNVGTPRDQSFESYNELTREIKKIMLGYQGIIHISAHDPSLQLINFLDNYQVIA